MMSLLRSKKKVSMAILLQHLFLTSELFDESGINCIPRLAVYTHSSLDIRLVLAGTCKHRIAPHASSIWTANSSPSSSPSEIHMNDKSLFVIKDLVGAFCRERLWKQVAFALSNSVSNN